MEAAIPAEDARELGDVRGLEQRLTQQRGVVPRFKQKFLLDGEGLEEAALLFCTHGLASGGVAVC